MTIFLRDIVLITLEIIIIIAVSVSFKNFLKQKNSLQTYQPCNSCNSDVDRVFKASSQKSIRGKLSIDRTYRLAVSMSIFSLIIHVANFALFVKIFSDNYVLALYGTGTRPATSNWIYFGWLSLIGIKNLSTPFSFYLFNEAFRNYVNGKFFKWVIWYDPLHNLPVVINIWSLYFINYILKI